MTKFKCKFIDKVRINNYVFVPEVIYDDMKPPKDYIQHYKNLISSGEMKLKGRTAENHSFTQWKGIFDMWKLKHRKHRPTFEKVSGEQMAEIEKLKAEIEALKSKSKDEVKSKTKK